MNNKTIYVQQFEVGCKYYVFLKDSRTRIDAFVLGITATDIIFDNGSIYQNGKINLICDYCSIPKELIEKAVLIEVY